MLTVFIVNEQKQEIVDFIRNSDGTVRQFKDENEVMDFRSTICYGFRYTGNVFDVKEGEIIDWFNN